MLEEQVMVFRIQEEEYALPMLVTRGIVQPDCIHKMPEAPDYLEGVIEVEGQNIPIVRLAEKFGLAGGRTDYNQVVLVAVGACEIGIMAEAVIENFPMTATCLDAATRGRSYLGSCIQGLCEMGNRIIILLDIARVFSPEELAVLHKLNSRLAD